MIPEEKLRQLEADAHENLSDDSDGQALALKLIAAARVANAAATWFHDDTLANWRAFEEAQRNYATATDRTEVPS